MEGWLVRTEEPLPGQTGTVSRAVQEGQRVAAGETVATVYSDDSALQTVSRIETLELQLQQLQFALTSYLDPDAALKDMGRVDVRLAKGFDQSIRMSVVSVSREENGQAAVVLSSTRYLAQTTLLRHQAADAVLHTYQGLRVPADALRVSADGTTGVYCVDGENASFRPIELVYQGEGYALVKPAEGVRDTQTLRSGDQVIATSGELYDGKVIR